VKPNALREQLQQGKPAYGTMIQDVRTPSIGQIMALAGCDFLFFDMEHGPFNLETIADMVRGTRLAGVVPLVRVPEVVGGEAVSKVDLEKWHKLYPGCHIMQHYGPTETTVGSLFCWVDFKKILSQDQILLLSFSQAEVLWRIHIPYSGTQLI